MPCHACAYVTGITKDRTGACLISVPVLIYKGVTKAEATCLFSVPAGGCTTSFNKFGIKSIYSIVLKMNKLKYHMTIAS